MTENNPEPQSGADIDAVRADIEATRADLAHTVDELSDRLDVKKRASGSLHDAGQKVADTASRAKNAAPEPVQHALDRVAEKTGPLAHQVSDQAKPHRGKIVAGALVAVLVVVVVRRRGRKGSTGA